MLPRGDGPHGGTPVRVAGFPAPAGNSPTLGALKRQMECDDPTTGEFASWLSYRCFARSVRHRRRNVWTDAEAAFLATVRATIRERDVELEQGRILYRAQRGVDWRPVADAYGNEVDEEPTGYGAKRMKPPTDQATEGRANPAGISVLYLGTTVQTVISEVRPWIGARVSVGEFRIRRTLRVLDLSRGHSRSSLSEFGLGHLLGGAPLDHEKKERAVWIDIDNAFSQPVAQSDGTADYVPTQILSELFRDAGYDAIVYRSQFGNEEYNVVLFDPSDADIISRHHQLRALRGHRDRRLVQAVRQPLALDRATQRLSRSSPGPTCTLGTSAGRASRMRPTWSVG